jgi:hypothetical protein
MESKKALFGVHVGILAAASVGAVLAVGCSPEGNASRSEPTATVSEPLTPCDPTAPFDPPVPAFTGTALVDSITFSANGNTAYLTGKIPPAANHEVYVSTAPFSSLTKVDVLSSPTNSEKSVSLSADGLNLFFGRHAGRFNLFVATRSDASQPFTTAPTALPNDDPTINTSLHDQDPFSLGNQLFYATEPVDGQRDIRVATRQGTGWQTWTDLVTITNHSSSYDDYRPVLSSDGLTLYFSSTRPGVGGDTGGDIWITTRANTGAAFGTPTNLFSLNTNRIEYPAGISNDNCTLYFASNRDTVGGEYRLYKATRGNNGPTTVATAVKVIGGSITTNGYQCSSTCTFLGGANSTVVLDASATAIWGGSCTGHGGNPSGDGVLTFARDGVCTVTIPNGSPQPVGGSCLNPTGCQSGLECTLNVCRCPAGASCACTPSCAGKTIGMDDGCGGKCPGGPGCNPTASFNPPVPAFTGTTIAQGLTFSPDGLKAYVSAKIGTSSYDIYSTQRTATNAPFDPLQALSVANGTLQESAPFLTEDGKNLYLMKQTGSYDLAVSTRTNPNDAFGAPTLMSVNTSWHDQDPFVLSSFGQLYYSSERPTGTRELYVCPLANCSGENSTALSTVNSAAHEDYGPVLSRDGRTLYFASNRAGLGQDTEGDIWVATRSEVTQPFDPVTNLAALNSSRREVPVALSPDGCTLYFASNRDTGNDSDFRLYQATRGTTPAPSPVTTTVKIVGTGSVTPANPQAGFPCSGTCPFQGPSDTLVYLEASGQAAWSGSCARNGIGPTSSDGWLVLTNGGVCTITFDNATFVPVAGRVCDDPGDCLPGYQCTLGTCRCPVGTPGCICARDCDGKACGADDGCGGTCPCPTGAACTTGLDCQAGDTCISGTCQAVPWCNYAGGMACEPTVRVRQNALDRFYSMTNIVTIDVTVDDTNTSVTPVRTTWDDLVEEFPPTDPANNHPCYWDFQPPDEGRFDDRIARSVTISGLNYPAAAVTYTTSAGAGPDDDGAVRITKKSFCGSSNIAWDKDTQQLSVAHPKPSFKIRLPIQAEDGPLQTRYLVFNNSVQDRSFIRQAVGYRLFEKALLPHSRNNFARVNILRTDGSLIATWTYVNIEPIRAPYIENPFNNFTHHTITLDSGNDRRVPGNLYEFEKDDFDPERIVPPNNFIAPEGISNRNNVDQTEDLLIAAAKIQEEVDNQQQPGPVGSALQQAIDLDQFIRYFAMEVLLKHWDGYTENLNNVYVYNDTDDPGDGPTRFKFIPWGLDQILEPFDEEDEYPEDPNDGISKISLFRIGPPEGDKDDSGLGRLVRNNLALLNRLSDQIRIYRENVFSRDYINGDLNNFIVLMQTQLDALGELDTDEINEVREMIKVARSAAYYFGQGYTESYFAGERFLDLGALGLTTGDATGAFLIDKTTGSALFAGLENIPGGTPQQFEVYHGVQADNFSPARWWFETVSGTSGQVLRNEAFARYLYSSVDPLRVMATSVLNPDSGYNTEFETGEWEPETRVDNRFSGYLRLMSYPQSNYIRFTADDVSPTGQLRVTQTNPSANPPPLPSELAARLRLW